MRLATALIFGAFVGGGVAHAQSASPASKGYVEGVAQSAFGNVTSQSYGLEFGFTVADRIQVFGDIGHTGDTATSELAASAQLIGGFLSRTQTNVAYQATQPVTFGVGGLRYGFPTSAKVEPYVRVGAGVAQVEKKVTYTINGSDVTGSLAQYGVVLGTDLSGSETKMMLDFGGGVVWPVWRTLIIDFQYRYGRVFTSDQGLNLNRAGVGIGVQF